MNMGFRITKKAVRIHISSIMAKDLIATYQTMYHLWLLESQRVLSQLPSSASSPSSSQESTSASSGSVSENRDVEAPVSERNRIMNEELRRDPLHNSTETEKQNKNREI